MRETHCKLLTPNSLCFDTYAVMAMLPGLEGELSVLYGHEPMIVALKAGILRIKNDYKDDAIGYYISEGIAHIERGMCTVMVDHAMSVSNLNANNLKNIEDNIDELCDVSQRAITRFKEFALVCHTK